MSYYSGRGLRRPSNNLENPIYPNIKKALPPIRDAGRHWTVPEGEVMRNAFNTNTSGFLGDSVLIQSRDASRIQHGVSSSWERRDEGFRAPALIHEDELDPPSRRKRRPTGRGRLNHFFSLEQRVDGVGINDTYKYITTSTKSGNFRPVVELPYEVGRIDVRIDAPDRAPKMPIISVGTRQQLDYNPGTSGQMIDTQAYTANKIGITGVAISDPSFRANTLMDTGVKGKNSLEINGESRQTFQYEQTNIPQGAYLTSDKIDKFGSSRMETMYQGPTGSGIAPDGYIKAEGITTSAARVTSARTPYTTPVISGTLIDADSYITGYKVAPSGYAGESHLYSSQVVIGPDAKLIEVAPRSTSGSRDVYDYRARAFMKDTKSVMADSKITSSGVAVQETSYKAIVDSKASAKSKHVAEAAIITTPDYVYKSTSPEQGSVDIIHKKEASSMGGGIRVTKNLPGKNMGDSVMGLSIKVKSK